MYMSDNVTVRWKIDVNLLHIGRTVYALVYMCIFINVGFELDK